MTVSAAWLAELTDYVHNTGNLGPAQLSNEDAFVHVRLQDRTRQASQLTAWAAELRVVDATHGDFDESDPERRLNLRCVGWGRVRVVVTAAWPVDSRQTTFIAERIEAQDIPAILSGLVALENRGRWR